MKRFASNHTLVYPYVGILGILLLRLTVDHPYNFVPIFACVLFFGATRRRWEFPIPLLALIGVDVFLTTSRYSYALTSDQAVTWIWYLVVMALGAAMLRSTISAPHVLGASLLASVGFFLVSNFAVWATWSMYPKTGNGLIACYVAALPFFRNSLVSETACSLLIFVVYRIGVTIRLNVSTEGACA
jgi:hypothetical protein